MGVWGCWYYCPLGGGYNILVIPRGILLVVVFWKCYLTYENICYSRECLSFLCGNMCFILANMGILVLYLAKILSLFYGSTEIYIICMELLRRYGKVRARIFSQILLLTKDRCKRETNNNDNGIKFISDGFECQLC